MWKTVLSFFFFCVIVTQKQFQNHHTEIIEEFQQLIAALGTGAALIQSIGILTKVNTIWQTNPNYPEWQAVNQSAGRWPCKQVETGNRMKPGDRRERSWTNWEWSSLYKLEITANEVQLGEQVTNGWWVTHLREREREVGVEKRKRKLTQRREEREMEQLSPWQDYLRFLCSRNLISRVYRDTWRVWPAIISVVTADTSLYLICCFFTCPQAFMLWRLFKWTFIPYPSCGCVCVCRNLIHIFRILPIYRCSHKVQMFSQGMTLLIDQSPSVLWWCLHQSLCKKNNKLRCWISPANKLITLERTHTHTHTHDVHLRSLYAAYCTISSTAANVRGRKACNQFPPG